MEIKLGLSCKERNTADAAQDCQKFTDSEIMAEQADRSLKLTKLSKRKSPLTLVTLFYFLNSLVLLGQVSCSSSEKQGESLLLTNIERPKIENLEIEKINNESLRLPEFKENDVVDNSDERVYREEKNNALGGRTVTYFIYPDSKNFPKDLLEGVNVIEKRETYNPEGLLSEIFVDYKDYANQIDIHREFDVESKKLIKEDKTEFYDEELKIKRSKTSQIYNHFSYQEYKLKQQRVDFWDRDGFLTGYVNRKWDLPGHPEETSYQAFRENYQGIGPKGYKTYVKQIKIIKRPFEDEQIMKKEFLTKDSQSIPSNYFLSDLDANPLIDYKDHLILNEEFFDRDKCVGIINGTFKKIKSGIKYSLDKKKILNKDLAFREKLEILFNQGKVNIIDFEFNDHIDKENLKYSYAGNLENILSLSEMPFKMHSTSEHDEIKIDSSFNLNSLNNIDQQLDFFKSIVTNWTIAYHDLLSARFINSLLVSDLEIKFFDLENNMIELVKGNLLDENSFQLVAKKTFAGTLFNIKRKTIFENPNAVKSEKKVITIQEIENGNIFSSMKGTSLDSKFLGEKSFEGVPIKLYFAIKDSEIDPEEYENETDFEQYSMYQLLKNNLDGQLIWKFNRDEKKKIREYSLGDIIYRKEGIFFPSFEADFVDYYNKDGSLKVRFAYDNRSRDFILQEGQVNYIKRDKLIENINNRVINEYIDFIISDMKPVLKEIGYIPIGVLKEIMLSFILKSIDKTIDKKFIFDELSAFHEYKLFIEEISSDTIGQASKDAINFQSVIDTYFSVPFPVNLILTEDKRRSILLTLCRNNERYKQKAISMLLEELKLDKRNLSEPGTFEKLESELQAELDGERKTKLDSLQTQN